MFYCLITAISLTIRYLFSYVGGRNFTKSHFAEEETTKSKINIRFGQITSRLESPMSRFIKYGSLKPHLDTKVDPYRTGSVVVAAVLLLLPPSIHHNISLSIKS